MSASRYRGPGRRGAPGRFRPAKKLILAGDLAAIIFIISVLLFLFLPFPFNAGTKAPAAGSPFVFLEGPGLDYLAFFYQSLPGMKPGKEDDAPPPENAAGLIKRLQCYPHLLLINEIAGFRGAGISGGHTPPGAEKSDEDSRSGEDKQTGPGSRMQNEPHSTGDPIPQEEERLSFLVDRNPQAPGERLPALPLALKHEKPLVLIYHTHASESFLPLSGKAYSDDAGQTVVALGEHLAKCLENNYGIPVLHHREVFDKVREGAYEKARPVMEQIIKQNPQLEVVIDLHRDGVSKGITTADIGGLKTGRILFVIGTRHSAWADNLRFTLFMQTFLDAGYPGLSRGIQRYACVYNQDLHPRSLLVEVGGYENTSAEVFRVIPMLAEAVARAFD